MKIFKKYFQLIYRFLIYNTIISDKLHYTRLQIVAVVFLFAYLAIGFRLISIGLDKNKIIEYETQNNETLFVNRANITDRNNILLASNLTTASLYVNPKIIIDHDEAANKLCEIFPELNYEQLVKDFKSNKNFMWIKRNLTPKEQFQVNNLGLPGLFFEKGEKRVYPHGNLLSHVLGYVGLDGKGLAGIEKYFDEKLISLNTKELKSLQLSIDVRAQNILHEELNWAMEEYKAIGAIGVIIDANNGEVISSVSLPDFDPHNPGTATSEQLFNRFSLGLYEPGSTFKSYTIAMALDSGAVNINDSYDVNAPIRVARFSITDYHAKGGWMSVPEIFMYSSNIGTAKISLDLGKKKQQSLLKLYGLLEPLNIEIPEKASPMYPSEARWSDISTMTISYGHGIAVTPLHLVRTMAAIVNGGYLNDITFIKQAENSKPPIRIIKEKTSDQMRKLFRLVVREGTGRKANIDGYVVGGKTGTANKTKKGGYHQNSRMSFFIGAFPINEPKYVMLVMLDEPKGTKATGGYATGGMTAAPIVGNVISRLGPLLNIPTVDENDPAIAEKLWFDFDMVNDALSSF
ncbi:MAG: peptidoglycan D,D-transpeptidase FtsI family protein [Alphaproteobacteria bacterium]